MIDRLQQLRQLANYAQFTQMQNQIEQQSQFQQKNVQGIDDAFFQQIKSVRQLLGVINNNIIKIQQHKAKYQKCTKSSQQRQNSQQMKLILNNNADIHLSIKKKLENLLKGVEQANQKNPDQPQTRMKRNFYISLAKEVSDTVQRQQLYQEQFRKTVKGKIVRQVKLIDRNITNQQMQQFIENPDLAAELFERKLYGQPTSTLKNAVSDIQDKFKDIKMLEVSVTRCLRMFQQLACLVYAQGQMIDDIAANVTETKDYVKKAEQKLKKGKQYHKVAQSSMCKFISGFFLIGLIGVVILAFIVF